MSEFSRDEFGTCVFVNLHQWQCKTSIWNISIWRSCRCCSGLWDVCGVLPPRSQRNMITTGTNHSWISYQKNTTTDSQKELRISYQKNIFQGVGCVENQHAFFSRQVFRFTCMSFQGGAPPFSLIFIWLRQKPKLCILPWGGKAPDECQWRSKQLEGECMWRCLHAWGHFSLLQDLQWSTGSIAVYQCDRSWTTKIFSEVQFFWIWYLYFLCLAGRT